MEILFGGKSHIGNTREVNQDNFFIKLANTEKGSVGLFVMCDGMGGLAKGEVASAIAVESFEKWFKDEAAQCIDKYENNSFILKSLVSLMNNINKNILKFSEDIGERVGTTASALLILFDKYFVVHIGDSRIYKIKRKIAQLTEDHTFIAMNVKKKIMTKEEARLNSRKNVLTQCLGVMENIEVFESYGKLKGNEMFVLCTDGLYNTLSDEDIYKEVYQQNISNNSVVERISESLIETAMNRGEKDNISAIIVKLNKNEESIIKRIVNLFNI